MTEFSKTVSAPPQANPPANPLSNSAQANSAQLMPCPCCGTTKTAAATECTACGAQQIAPRMARPVITLPKLGPAFTAVGLVAFVLVGFLAFWVINNDMKVGRALLVWAFGESTKATADMMRGDSHLLSYRIFSWDAWRGAFYASFAAIPLTLLGLRQAWRATKLALNAPTQFGGLRMSQASLALSLLLFSFFSAALVSGVPSAIERGKARRLATTRAAMYEHAQALQAYYQDRGTFPAEASDLKEAATRALPTSDYWETEFKYAPYSTVASRGTVGFSNFTLVSAGPDGEFSTADDIFMVDGVIVDKPLAAADMPASLLTPAKTRP